MSCEVKLNLFASISIILAIISLLMFISFDKKIGGNILNTNSYKTESSYYIADINGNQKEISEDVWNKSYKLTIITFVFVSIAGIFVVYLFVRYIFIPTLKNNFQKIKNYISKHKKIDYVCYI